MKNNRFSAISLAAAMVCTLAGQAAQSFDLRSYQQFSQEATIKEHEGKWLRINWLKDMNQAKARAAAEGKPILVFLVIGFHGKPHADDC